MPLRRRSSNSRFSKVAFTSAHDRVLGKTGHTRVMVESRLADVQPTLSGQQRASGVGRRPRLAQRGAAFGAWPPRIPARRGCLARGRVHRVRPLPLRPPIRGPTPSASVAAGRRKSQRGRSGTGQRRRCAPAPRPGQAGRVRPRPPAHAAVGFVRKALALRWLAKRRHGFSWSMSR